MDHVKTLTQLNKPITDTFYYLLENPESRQIGLFGSEIMYMTKTFSQNIYQKERGVTFDSNTDAYKDWLSYGRFKGITYAQGKNTILKIILKVKDEAVLLDKWIQYHAEIVGFHNIIIVDCGSSDERHLEILNAYSKFIMVLDYRKYYDHIHAVRGNRDFYHLISLNSKYVMILDADEFLVSYKDGVLTKQQIIPELKNSVKKIYYGAWLNNITCPAFLGDQLDWNSPINFSLDQNLLANGCFSGKSISISNGIFDIGHLGHNLHTKETVLQGDPSSFGQFFILHLDNLGPEVTRFRVLKHLKSKKAIPEDVNDESEIVRLLNIILEKNEAHIAILGYAQKYIYASSKASAELSFSTRILADGIDSDYSEELKKVIDGTDFHSIYTRAFNSISN